MTEEKQVVIKLSDEQIMSKQVSLVQLKEQIAHQELNISQLDEDIKSGFFLKQATVLLNGEKSKLAQMKHNVIALTEQIEKGEM
jgi:hypothetical protein